MRSGVGIAIKAAVAVLIGFGSVAGLGAPVAYAEPSDSPEPPSFPGIPGFPSRGSGDSDGGSGHSSTIPVFEAPESTVGGQTPIVVRRTPGTPEDVPPPVYIPPVPEPVYTPVELPQVPVEAPVVVAPPVPVAVAVPAPVEVPVVQEPPAAPPVTPQVLLTSSVEPGTQALTLILMFLVAGAWVYGHRIVSHWTVGKTNGPATA